MNSLQNRPCLAVLAVCLAASVSVAAAQDYPEYEIKARVNVSEKKITATQTVSLANPSSHAVREVYFHIYPNRRYTPGEQNFMLRFGGYFKVDPYPEGFPQADMRIQSITVDGKKADYAIEGRDKTLLKVFLDRELSSGQTVRVVMDYTVALPLAFGRFGWNENVIKASRWYPQLAVLDDQGWHINPFYPFHRPFFSQASRYSVWLTVPQEQVVVHSGREQEVIDNGDATKTYVIQTPQPVREFTFAMSPDYKILTQEQAGVIIHSVYLPGQDKRARQALEYAKDAMAFYEKILGPYPYPEFSVVPVPLGYGGEQMANMIFIDTRAYRLPGFLERYFDFLISHETGHQWLYNAIGVNEYGEMWLEEGVNSFFILEHLENKYGKDAQVISYPRWFQGWEWTLPRLSFSRVRDYRYKLFARQGFDAAVVRDLSSFQEPSSIFALAYGKGSSIVRMLRAVVGEETFNRIWRRIYAEYRFKNLSVKDFQAVCEQESAQKLDWFFGQWLYGKGKLDYSVAQVKGSSVTLENRGDIRMPVPVKVIFQNGEQKTFSWDGQKKQDAVHVEGNGPIAKVVIDPDGNILDLDRTNNFWPRQIALKPVPLYFGLYDMPVFLPEDSYNVVLGPELANSGLGMKVSAQKPYDQVLYGATDYEFGESLLHSRAGYQLKNFLHSPAALGFEVANTTDYDGGEEDLVSGKISLRRELWPAAYGLTDLNDHVSLYLIRNQNINDGADFISGREDARNVDYSRRQEAITGLNLHLNRSGPYPDPKNGYQLETFYENAGHFLGATQFFHRSVLDWSGYRSATPQSVVAMRLKYGWGYPDDKNLYCLGGYDGLRGYGRKTIRGSNSLLGSLEYRFPIKDRIGWYALDNLIGLEAVKGVVFFDAGRAWYDDFEHSNFKKDAGLGLRFTVNVGGFLEKLIVRLDAAQAIGEPKSEPRFWFGINQAF